ncbi:MAG: ZIP family metal transporter [Nitrososphaerales archaeon]
MIALELVILGTVAGFTIFLGLPVAVMKSLNARVKGFLNAITIGVLIFILIEVLPSAKQYAESAVLANEGTGIIYVIVLIAGLGLGLFSLVLYETRFIRVRQRRTISSQSQAQDSTRSVGLGEAEARGQGTSLAASSSLRKESAVTLSADDAKQIAFSIAVGIGVHNFSEGLAIGQSFASAALGLSIFLAIGFAIHNATEGFGIAAPMAGYRPPLTYLATLGFIGGFPTLLGTLIGGIYPPSPLALTFFLALAAGALIYIISGMFYVARRQTSNELFMLGLFIGFLVAYGTDLFLAIIGA